MDSIQRRLVGMARKLKQNKGEYEGSKLAMVDSMDLRKTGTLFHPIRLMLSQNKKAPTKKRAKRKRK